MESSAIRLRTCCAADLDDVIQVFTDAVHVLAQGEYNAAQRSAWAPRPPDRGAWHRRLQGQRTWLAVSGRVVLGFISYEAGGHIDLLYVRPSHARRGVASALYQHAETDLASTGTTVLTTEASATALPFFEHAGFIAIEEQQVFRCGVPIRRFVMRKRLAPDRPTGRHVPGGSQAQP